MLDGEYYCPNCNATLNDQPGFDPDVGAWTCQECGQTLYGDDLEDTMDSFPGVVWYCDSCGAVLNKQLGFSDIYANWECSECGHLNPISEENILGSDDDEEDDDDDEYGFGDEWEYDHPVRCENCNRLLNKQDGFEDAVGIFYCEGCGHPNKISSDEDDDDNGYYSGGSDYRADDSDDEEDNPQEEAVRLIEFYRRQIRREKAAKRAKKYWKVWLILFLVLAAAFYTGYRAYERSKLRSVGISAADCVGMTYTQVKRQLLASDFTNITLRPLDDLEYAELDQANVVSRVSIAGNFDFVSSARFPYDAKIFIYFHSAEKKNPPVTSSDAKGLNYDDVAQQFRDAGFGNIELEADYDLLLGWLNKEGSVKWVMVNGSQDYFTSSEYQVDATVKIVYHAFQRDKKAEE